MNVIGYSGYTFDDHMAQELFDRLNDFCDRPVQPKTAAIERGLTKYINAYDKLKKQAEMK